MNISYENWEKLCIEEFNKNPNYISKLFQEFKEHHSLEAYDMSAGILQDNIIQHQYSYQSKFQACLILQYTLLNKKWTYLSNDQINDIIQFLWNVLLKNNKIQDLPKYLINVYISTLALTYKRYWTQISPNDIQGVFQQISVCLQQPLLFTIGCNIMKFILEEFSSFSSAKIILPLEFHRQCHDSFQTNGLDIIFEYGLQCFLQSSSKSLSPINTGLNYEKDISLIVSEIQASTQVLVEVLYWDFNSLETQQKSLGIKISNSHTMDRYHELLSKIPQTWMQNGLVSSQLITVVFDTYEFLRNNIDNIANMVSTNHVLLETFIDCITLIGQLIIAFVSIPIPYEHVSAIDMITNRLLLSMKHLIDMKAQPSSVLKPFTTKVYQKLFEQFSLSIQMLFSNYSLETLYGMSCFEQLILGLANLTSQLTSEMYQLANYKLGSSSNSLFANEDIDNLFENWRVDVIYANLETWCLILDNPMILAWQRRDTSSSPSIGQSLKLGLQSIGKNIFEQLFQTILISTLSNSTSSNNAEDDVLSEEDDENEDIHKRSLDELIAITCSIGRTCFVPSTELLQKTIQQASQQKKHLHILESYRICILFALHLLDDTYRSETIDSNTFSTSTSRLTSNSETPCIPSFILDSFLVDGNYSLQALQSLFLSLESILQWQYNILLEANGSDLLSPVLLNYLMQFYNAYVVRYEYIDPKLYASDFYPILSSLASSRSDATGNVTPKDIYADLIPKLILIVTTMCTRLPLENELMFSCSRLMSSLSLFPNLFHYQSIQVSMMNLLHTITNSSSQLNGIRCTSRFSNECLNHFFHAFVYISCKTCNIDFFLILCQFIHQQVSTLSPHPQQQQQHVPSVIQDSDKVHLLQCVSYLQGLSSCMLLNLNTNEFHRNIHQLFNEAMPIFLLCLHQLSTYDDILRSILLLLRDYTEMQVAHLSPIDGIILMKCGYLLMNMSSKRLKSTPSNSRVNEHHNDENESQYHSEIILILLQFLNHLSNIDFLLSDDKDQIPLYPSTTSIRIAYISTESLLPNAGFESLPYEVIVSKVLIYGMNLLIPLMSADFLRSYPLTCERYFAFINFILSSYELEFVEFMNTTMTSIQHEYETLNHLIEHLLWACGIIDSSIARYASHAIQSLAICQYNSRIKGSLGFSDDLIKRIFIHALDRLVNMSIFPNLCDYGITWDRIDAISNAIMTLIVLEKEAFLVIAKTIISNQPEIIQQALIQCFENLTTMQDINLTKIDKKNKHLFVENMRQFLLQVRPLVICK